jgi:hypothetical protein
MGGGLLALYFRGIFTELVGLADFVQGLQVA